MATRRPKLSEAQRVPETITTTEVKTTSPATSPTGNKWPRASTRIGKRGLNMWVDQAAFVQIGVLAREENKSIQELLVEALNGLFANRGLPRF